MRHYLVDTYHGPLVYAQDAGQWLAATPFRRPEIFDGTIPDSYLRHARPISADEARAIIGPVLSPPPAGGRCPSRATA